MSTTAHEKRLAKIEEKLTPKEWAIRLADAIREYPSLDAYVIASSCAGEALTHRAETLLLEQVEEKYPGPRLRDQRRRAVKAVLTEYDTLRYLVFDVNETMRTRVDKAGVEVALRLQALQTIILQDAIRQTATIASDWIEGEKPTGKAKDARKAILDALAAFSSELPDVYPPTAQMWAETTGALAVDLARHKAAVSHLQSTYFERHGILAMDIEAELDGLIQTVSKAIVDHNEYLTVRGKSQDRSRLHADQLALPPLWGTTLADRWLQEAQDKAVLQVLSWMGDSAGAVAAWREIAQRQG